MKRRAQDWILLSALASAACLVGACGKDEPEPASMDELTGAIESPTGTVEASNAADIGRAFEESMGVPSAGQRDAEVVRAQSSDLSCTVSGNISVESSSSESAEVAYNNCCEAADCCLDGVASVFYDASGSADYSICADYDLSYDCEGLNTDLAFSYCLSAEGLMTYVIEISGDTFAVTGSMSGGNGSLTISGENGTFTCDYTDYAGTCTGNSGTFSF